MSGAEYFVLMCMEPDDWDDSALVEGIPPPAGAISWRVGQPFPVAPTEPIQVTLDPSHCDRLMILYKKDALLITRGLLKAFRAAGVDNLDAYHTVITHPTTGFVTTDYVAANLIGLVSAADLNRSRVVGGSSDHLIDTDFDGFTVDPAKARRLLMFRLAENTSAIVVHRSLRDHLCAAGFDQLRFVPPETWVG